MSTRFLDIDGTSKDSFTIGVGQNKTEFKSFSGILYFRNINGAWRKVASTEDVAGIQPRVWTAAIDLTTGEIVSHDGVLFVADSDFTTTASFEADSVNLSKFSDYNNYNIIDVVTDSSPYQFSSTVSSHILFRGGAGGGSFVGVMPDASTLRTGQFYIVQNDSTYSIEIRKYDGTTAIDTVNVASAIILVYTDVSGSNGAWTTYDFTSTGSGTTTGNSIVDITQSNSFVFGNVVGIDTDSLWKKAISDGGDLIGIGVVTEATGSAFKATIVGPIDLTGHALTPFTPSQVYFLSDTAAGELTTVEPAVSQPIIKAISTTEAVVLPHRPAESGAGNTVFSVNYDSAGGETEFAIPHEVVSESYLWIIVGGVSQSTDRYTVSGTTVTLSTVTDGGDRVSIRGIKNTSFNSDLSQFINRTNPTVVDTGLLSLGTSSTSIELFDSNNPRIAADVYFDTGSAAVDIYTYTSGIFSDTKDNGGTINIYVETGTLYLQNNSGLSITFVILKKT